MTIGYAGTPHRKELGFEPGMKVCALHASANDAQLIDGPNNWIMVDAAHQHGVFGGSAVRGWVKRNIPWPQPE
jgi:hypothetical protein